MTYKSCAIPNILKKISCIDIHVECFLPPSITEIAILTFLGSASGPFNSRFDRDGWAICLLMLVEKSALECRLADRCAVHIWRSSRCAPVADLDFDNLFMCEQQHAHTEDGGEARWRVGEYRLLELLQVSTDVVGCLLV